MTATIGAGAAYAAVTHAELDALWRSSGLVETLPPPPTAPTPIPPSYAAGSEAPAVTAGDPYPLPVDRPQTRPMPGPSTRRRVRSPSWAIMSGTDRRGRWNVRRRTNAVAVMVPLAWFLGVAFGPDREHALAGIDRPLVARPAARAGATLVDGSGPPG